MDDHNIDRRNVLKLLGAGIATGVAFTGTASARENYGNGLGSFLNEKAQLKDNPIWDGGIVDRTGLTRTEVIVGSTTTLDVPEEDLPPEVEPPEDGPFGYAPRAIKVSPGTTVKFIWSGNFFPELDPNDPWPHDVVSLERDENDDPIFESDFQNMGTFEHTFEETGKHRYYCSPHGNPYEDSGFPYNLMGMRGAVKVV